MTTKATRDVLDMSVRPVENFVLNGAGTASIDGTPIGASNPNTGNFTNLTASNLTVNSGVVNFTNSTVDFTGSVVSAIQAVYADLAEYYEASEELEPGTVVKIGGEKEIMPTDTAGDHDVFGIISTEPAFVMNQSQERAGHYAPVVLIGRAPCKVIGPVTKGCRLVAMPGGVAMAAGDEGGTPFARSLVDDAGEEPRLIEATIVTVK